MRKQNQNIVRMNLEDVLRKIIREEVTRAISYELTPYLQAEKRNAAMQREFGSRPLSVDGAAAFTGLAKQSIYKMTSQGTIPFHKQGGKLWFFEEELTKWIKRENPGHILK